MKQRAIAIIGMNYGDEGKGHITNYFSDINTLNIRFNGGAQASHAVHLSNGLSHVFHHFGSGSLRGARTLLANHFIVNPFIFAAEADVLLHKVSLREIFIDPRCRVTTPYDMIINGFNAKYKKIHNTCGVGINETIERSMYRQLKITARDLIEKNDDEISKILNTIENEYLPFRIDELKLPLNEFQKFFHLNFPIKSKIIESFMRLRAWMREKMVVIWPDDNLVDKFLAKDKSRKIVFEGGQGMLLDQNRKKFMPYLTRSNTGIKNILELLKTIRTKLDFEVYLVSRCYYSRHGDGPLWNNTNGSLPYSGITDYTNPENQWQGKMRYGYLNLQWHNQAIKETEDKINQKRPICFESSVVNVAMTCLDQIKSALFMYSSNKTGNIKDGKIEDFPRIKLLSYGNTEKDIKLKAEFNEAKK